WVVRLPQAYFYGLPAACVYLALKPPYIEPKWQFQYLLSLYPFEALFSVPLGFERPLSLVSRMLQPTAKPDAWDVAGTPAAVVLRVLVPLAFLAAFAAAWLRRPRSSGEQVARLRPFWALGTLLTGSLMLLLCYSAVRLTPSEYLPGWSYLWEPRY